MSNTPLPTEFDPEIVRRLGWLVIRWSYLESLVSELFCWAIEADPTPMTVVTANVSTSTLLQWTRTLVDERRDDPALASEIRELLIRIDEVRPDRNAYVHGLWGLSAIPNSAIVQTIRLERNPMITEEVATTADLDEIVNETLDLIVQLHTLLIRLGVQVNPTLTIHTRTPPP